MRYLPVGPVRTGPISARVVLQHFCLMTKLYFVNGFSELNRITPDEFCLFSLGLDDVRLSGIALISSYVAVPFLLKEGFHEITTPVDD